MKLYQLNDAVVHIKGNAASFLNGLTSNTLDVPWNAFLNQHGRIVTTFRQRKINDDEFQIFVPRVALEGLMSHVDRYAKLSHTQIITTQQKAYINVDIPDQWLIDTPMSYVEVTEEEFTLCRLRCAIPLLGVDYQVGEFILNVHETNYVSYTKGCFLGQEPVAKVHNRSKPTRRLEVKYQRDCSPEQKMAMTSTALDPQTNQLMGFVFIR